jgi:hypothetical protein
MCSRAFSWHVIILQTDGRFKNRGPSRPRRTGSPVLAVLPDETVNVGGRDDHLSAPGNEVDREAPLVGTQVEGEGQLERRDVIGASLETENRL